MRWVFIACALTTTVATQAQTPQPAFEVASVKVNKAGSGSPQRAGVAAGDRISFTNVTLLVVIQNAYDSTEVLGGPAWIGKQGQPNWDVDRFDVTAKAPAPTTRDELKAMLRTLLAERFKLTVHTEPRSEPIWAVVVARRDGRLGPRLHSATASCQELRAKWEPQTPGEPDPCGSRSFATALVTGRMSVHGFPLDQLGMLAIEVGRRPFVNKTGLTGFYDWDLSWTPQRFSQAAFDRSQFPDINPDGPSIFTAVEEQLGLKLVSQKGESPVLVIDHVERPSEN